MPKTEMTVAERLAEPFPPEAVGWKPQSIKGDRAMAVAYIDARDVMDRLDEVLGNGNWYDHYQVLNDGCVICSLAVRYGDGDLGPEWVVKQDVGTQSEQPDGGDRLKAAFSDALKRAAIKFGIGRYLYRLPIQWADYDSMKKQFRAPPNLPAWAIPKGTKNMTDKEAKLFADWEEWFNEGPGLADVNKQFQVYLGLPQGRVRDAVRDMFRRLEEANGWVYNAETKQFQSKGK
jgi:hypothetical protein